MLLLEAHGPAFTRRNQMDLWLRHLPVAMTFGPERMMMIRSAMASWRASEEPPWTGWTGVLNPGEERCGALIRAEAYGYACPGRPEGAARLAWQDASFTHRRTGVYGAMFVAALTSLTLACEDRMAIVRSLQAVARRMGRLPKVVAEQAARSAGGGAGGGAVGAMG